jgi:hypothetical protein
MKCGRLVAKLTGICGASILASFLASPYNRRASQTILDFFPSLLWRISAAVNKS